MKKNEQILLTLSNTMSYLAQHYIFPVPNAFLDFNSFESNFSENQILPSSYLF
jgi:hypothetical protein